VVDGEKFLLLQPRSKRPARKSRRAFTAGGGAADFSFALPRPCCSISAV
jgi:hypothetical protein